MKVRNVQDIGNYFNKESIFLATVSSSNAETKELVKAGSDSKIPDGVLDKLINEGAISSEQYDVFYKDDKGYTRFVEEGPETFVGDGSDGKGIIKNIVPIWEYYSEEQVTEIMINDKFMAICILDSIPLEKYNRDYNKV